MVWEMQTSQSHQLVAGCHQSTHGLTAVSLLTLQGDRGKGLGAGTLVVNSPLGFCHQQLGVPDPC